LTGFKRFGVAEKNENKYGKCSIVAVFKTIWNFSPHWPSFSIAFWVFFLFCGPTSSYASEGL